MDNNNRNYEIFSVLLNESEEGISFAVASPKLQKKIAAWAKAGQMLAFDYLDLPKEERNYIFSNIEPLFIMHPNYTSYLFFNTQEALKTRQDYITLNFSRDLLIRTHKNIIFFMTKEVYENVVRIAHDINSSTKLRLFFEDEEPTGILNAKNGKDGEAVGDEQAAGKTKDTALKGEKAGDGYDADKKDGISADDDSGSTMEKLREDLLRGKRTLVFGIYPQGATGEVKPLSWRVLDVKGSRALLITEKLIDAVPYNSVRESVTWETCTLRKWMNEVFIKKAFSEDEASHIAEMPIVNNKNMVYNTDGGVDTTDRVFALSIEEAMRYFSGDNDRMAEVTPYAAARGSYYYILNERRMLGRYGQARKTGWWWLRSPGFYSHLAAYVFTGGAISEDGRYVVLSAGSVRPALWLNL